MNRQVNGLCRCSTNPMVLFVCRQHPFWLVRACAALMVTWWHGSPAYPYLTDEKACIGEGHVEATQLNPGPWLWGPWAFPAAQAASLYDRLNHAGFEDPIIIPRFFFFFFTSEVAVKILKPIAMIFQTAAFMRCSFQMNGNNRKLPSHSVLWGHFRFIQYFWELL